MAIIISGAEREYSELQDLIETKPERLYFAALEYPIIGTRINGPLMPLSGWVVLPRDANRKFWVSNNKMRVSTITNFYQRQDLNQFAIASGLNDCHEILGFECVVPVFLFDTTLSLDTIPAGQESSAKEATKNCLTMFIRKIQTKEIGDHGPFPVFISSLGRSGSTLMHALLSAHPNGVGEKSYPRESKLCQAIMCDSLGLHLAGVTVSPDWGGTLELNPYFSKRLGTEILLQGNGRNYDYLYSEIWESRKLHALDIVNKVYTHMVTTPQSSKSYKDIRYFVEKSNNAIISCLAKSFYESVYDLVLIRDPRDLVASAVQYHLNTTPADFAEFVDDFDAATFTLNNDLLALDQALDYKEGISLVVKYEDLVEMPVKTLDKIFQFIKQPLSEDQIRSVLLCAELDLHDVSSQHITSGKTRDLSIGRWRRDMSHEQQFRCEDVFGWFIKKYYDIP